MYEMYDQIAEKIKMLNQKKASVNDSDRIINEADRIDWIFSCMKTKNFPLEKSEMKDILNGRLHVEVTLDDYTQIERYKELFQYVKDTLGIESELDQKILIRLNGIIVGRQTKLRKNLIPLRQYSHLPPKPEDVMKELRRLFKELYTENKANIIERGAYLHNEIIRISPFDEQCEATARSALFYYLMQKGLYPVNLAISSEEYTDMITDYLNEKHKNRFTKVLERAIYNKIDFLFRILEYTEEENDIDKAQN